MSYHPVFWVFVAAVAGPLLGQIPVGFRVPVVVIEVLLGILIGPHVMGLVHYDAFLSTMHTIAMAATLFMAGMELDFSEIKGRPLTLAVGGWGISVALGLVVVGIFHLVPAVHAPMMVTLALCTTGLGTLIPIFRDGGQLGTKFGRLMIAAGTIGEVGPIVAMSLLLSQRYSTWQEVGFLVVFLAIVGVVAAVGAGARPPRVLEFLSRQMHASLATAGTHLVAGAGGIVRAGRGIRIREHLRRVRGGHDRGTGHPRRRRQDDAREDRRRFLRMVLSVLLRRHRRQVRHHGAGQGPDDDAAGPDIRDPASGDSRSTGIALSQ